MVDSQSRRWLNAMSMRTCCRFELNSLQDGDNAGLGGLEILIVSLIVCEGELCEVMEGGVAKERPTMCEST